MSGDHSDGAAHGGSALERARAVADAVCYEGYILYPYTASSGKNRVRWQFGVLGPIGAEDDSAGEGPAMQTECLLETGLNPAVEITVRFLHVQTRVIEQAGGRGFAPVERLDVDDKVFVPWDEAVEQTLETGPVQLALLLDGEQPFPIEVAGGTETETLTDTSGQVVGRVVRHRWPLTGTLRVSTERTGIDGLLRVRARIENDAHYDAELAREPVAHGEPFGTRRQVAMRRSLAAAHTLLTAHDGAFVSLTDPPESARSAVAACRNERTWPVLVGDQDERDVLLSSPIILYDHPEIAPESPGDLFDATEIDELLNLRIMTLTEDEKREARATDPRAAAIVDQADDLPPEILERLHGAVRSLKESGSPDDGEAAAAGFPSLGGSGDDVPWWDPEADATVSPTTDHVRIGGTDVAAGSKVRLRPSGRADAQDLFLIDRTATVVGVVFDVDDQTHVVVALDDDPGADLNEAYGRYYYFHPDEVEPLSAGTGPGHGAGAGDAP